ncbi:MAG: VanZ family protein [Planctomycetaceae bacterium]|jgi:glycopeptide antibiotics resistance protein|nr:VanZ family protein [Planctomycetaceae bacterium]
MNWLRLLHYVTLCYAVFLTLLLWLPNPKELLYGWQPSEATHGYEHLITFMLLGFLVELGRRKRSLLFWSLLLVFYTFFTEIIQDILPIRSFEWIDVFQDLCGIVFGLGLAVFCRFASEKMLKSKK